MQDEITELRAAEVEHEKQVQIKIDNFEHRIQDMNMTIKNY